MSEKKKQDAPLQKSRRAMQEARRTIVAQLYKRNWTYRKIQAEVMKRLGLEKYSLSVVKSDIDALLAEWREQRFKDTDELLELELARIDHTCEELWEQWERSKEESKTTSEKTKSQAGSTHSLVDGKVPMKAKSHERRTYTTEHCGNPAFISEIRQQLMERRKLLGLYAPEKKEIGGALSFTEMLMASNMLDEEEEPQAEQETTA